MAEIIFANGVPDTFSKSWEKYLSERESYILVIDELNRTLWIKGREYGYPNQSFAFSFLCYIASNPIGAFLRYEDIHKTVWQISDNKMLSNDNNAMSKNVQTLIRRDIDALFGSKEKREKYIEFVAGQGIRTTANMNMLIRMPS
jgi:hypothetical protein